MSASAWGDESKSILKNKANNNFRAINVTDYDCTQTIWIVKATVIGILRHPNIQVVKIRGC